MKEIVNTAIKHAKRIIMVVIGFTILIIGIVMIILPGPAILVIPLGLAILAGEFVWARKLLHKVKSGVQDVKDFVNSNSKKNNKP
ncbi:MAG: PGPGW domain-containing protein [bacterium]